MKLRQRCRGWQWVLPVLILDRAGKIFALRFLKDGGARNLIRGLLSLAYVENRGMAFGMAQGRGWLLICLTSIIMIALLVYLLSHEKESKLFRTGLWLLIGGGLGNLYDRIAYGFVVDFIRLDFISFPVFNPADIAVCTGVGLAALAVLMEEGRKKHGR